MNAKSHFVGALLVCAGFVVSGQAAAQTVPTGSSSGVADSLMSDTTGPGVGNANSQAGTDLTVSNSTSPDPTSLLSPHGLAAEDLTAQSTGDVGSSLTPVDVGSLADASTGQSSIVSWTDQNLAASNTGNSATAGGDISSGAVSVGTDAFSGFDGIGNFVINTGHMNNLQGVLSVNLVMTPPTGGQ
jgi:hypothetical protein